jgi:high-affinity nickel permease
MFKKISDKYFIPVTLLLVVFAAAIIINRSAKFFDTRSAVGYLILVLFFILFIIEISILVRKIVDQYRKTRNSSSQNDPEAK